MELAVVLASCLHLWTIRAWEQALRVAGSGLTELSLGLCPRAAWHRSFRGQRLWAEEWDNGEEKERRDDMRAEDLDAG